MKLSLHLASLLAASTLLLGACATHATGRLNLDADGVALHGYDPVSYQVPDGPVRGKGSLRESYDGATYLFANQDNRTRFLRDPDYFVPLYGGWCAWAMVDGEKVDVDPKNFLLTPEGLMLFYKSILIDTREKWLEGDVDALTAKADAAWARLEEQAKTDASGAR